MTASAAAIATLTSAEFQTEVYGSVSLAARLAAAVSNRANAMHLALQLRRLNKRIQSLLDLVNDSLSGKRTLEKTEEVTPQRLQALADNLDFIIRTLEYLHESMRRAGLANNSLTAGALKTFYTNLEPLKDLADWIDLAAKPEEVNSIFARAQAEMERGELYHLKRVE